jgi:aminopeptidase N
MKNTILIMAFTLLAGSLDAQLIQHRIHATMTHDAGKIHVNDTLVFPSGYLADKETLEFSLNKNLSLEIPDRGISIESSDEGDSTEAISYRIRIPKQYRHQSILPLTYGGIINDQIQAGAAEYARGFSETRGIICSDGVYLAGSSFWVPSLEGAGLFTFDLNVELDESWGVVSQGTRTVNEVRDGQRIVRYESPDPTDEVFLIAGPWTEYGIMAGDVLVQAFLRTADEELANRYLGVTSYYLGLYNRLIGPYPYTKFALVENFWETGYGMPSFTLLGEQVIRFPWILHSSYPHELLHNYWGNSVYVDYSGGNWCEGITAYMADHLIKEQQGQAGEYRRNTLQKFTDYVNPENDFPPSEFVSRNNPAEEAIGYGKVMMFNNMLREKFGDDAFLKAYSDFYAENRFRHASFDDIRASFEKVTGQNLQPFFDQWIGRKGAPSLSLSDVQIRPLEGAYELSFSLTQQQEGDPFHLDVPVAIYVENEEQVTLVKELLEGRSQVYTHRFSGRPLKISIDPQFNLMRLLDRSEVPSTLSQLFGAEQALVVLPGESLLSENYAKLAAFWQATQAAQDKELEIVRDSELDRLPSDRPVWILGFENRFYPEVRIGEKYGSFLTAEENEQIASLEKENSLAYAIPGKDDPGLTLGFVGTHNAAAIDGLSRKLLHYGSYGYLGFEGDAPDNVLKGVFPVLGSRLDYVIPYPDSPEITRELPVREALGGAH